MTAELRTLPIRLAPLPGEALDSWLGAIMRRSSIDLRDLLIAAGPPFPTGVDHVPDYTTYLTAAEADRLVHLTGTDLDLLHTMTLRRYDGRALTLHDTRRVVSRVRLWGRGVGSRYCPRCLTETDGRWPLRSRLTWSIACTDHQVLLAHTCPGLRTVAASPPRHQAPGRLARVLSTDFRRQDLRHRPDTQ